MKHLILLLFFLIAVFTTGILIKDIRSSVEECPPEELIIPSEMIINIDTIINKECTPESLDSIVEMREVVVTYKID